MTPPGWRSPAAEPPLTYSSSARPPSSSTAVIAPAVAGARRLCPRLHPGLHLVAGFHGAGKTSFIVQVAVEAALSGASTRLVLPDTPRREAALRVAATLAGQSWTALDAQPPEKAEAALARLEGSRFGMLAFEDLSADSDDSGWGAEPGGLLVLDRPLAAPEALLRVALETNLVVLVGLPSRTQAPVLPTPLGRAVAAGADDALLARAETAWLLAQRSDGALVLELAKHRRGPTGTVAVHHQDGAFVDAEQAPALELELEDNPPT